MNPKFISMLTESTNQLYMGKYNWHGQIHTLYTQAKSEKQAHVFLCNRLAELLKIAPYAVGYYYKTNPNSYRVTLDISKEQV